MVKCKLKITIKDFIITVLLKTKTTMFTSNTTGATSGAGTAYPSGVPEFPPPCLNGVRVSIFSAMLKFVDRCLSFCPFSFGHCVVCPPIYGFWLPFVVSSNSPYVTKMVLKTDRLVSFYTYFGFQLLVYLKIIDLTEISKQNWKTTNTPQ
jgi:hypothetical protein